MLKHRLLKEGNQTVTNCNQLKLRADDGKMRMTDVADTEQLFRLIQSIPSPKAEPFKLWMAQVASQRIDQMQDPEKSIDQAIVDYKRLGYSDAWINQRIKSIYALFLEPLHPCVYRYETHMRLCSCLCCRKVIDLLKNCTTTHPETMLLA